MVLEMMEGGELFDRISKEKRFTERKAARYFKKVHYDRPRKGGFHPAFKHLFKMVITFLYKGRAVAQW